MLKKDYSRKDWEERENFYIESVNKLVVPKTTTTTQLRGIASEIDTILSQAYFDKATVYKKLDTSKSLIDRTEQQAWIKIDTSTFEIEKGKKPIKEEKEGLVKEFVSMQFYPGTEVALYNYYDEMKARANFIDSVINSLKNKSGVVLNHITLLKLEKELEGANF